MAPVSAGLRPRGRVHALFEDARVLGAPGVEGAEGASQKLMAELKNTRLAMTGRFASVTRHMDEEGGTFKVVLIRGASCRWPWLAKASKACRQRSAAKLVIGLNLHKKWIVCRRIKQAACATKVQHLRRYGAVPSDLKSYFSGLCPFRGMACFLRIFRRRRPGLLWPRCASCVREIRPHAYSIHSGINGAV